MSDEAGLSKLTRQVLYGLDHDLFQDDLGQAVLRLWQLGLSDAKTAGILDRRVQRHQFQQAMRRVPFSEPAALRAGAVVLGLDVEQASRQVRLPRQAFNGHSLTVATTGAGKSTRAQFYALQIAGLGCVAWLFDLRKREWRRLRPCLQRLGVDLIVVPGRSLRLNPLQVPHRCSPSDWAVTVAEMLVSVLQLPPRASKLIQVTLHGLYRQHGVFDGVMQYPTLFELREAVKADTGANPPARLALLDSLDPVLQSLGPDVLGYRRGWRTHDLARYSLAVELAGLAETDKNLLLNVLVLGEFTSRIAQGLSNVPMDLWIGLDEGQRLCAATGGQGPGVISDLLGLVRGTGIGLDLSVQSAHGLAPQVLSNTNLKMIGRCGSYGDLTAIGGSMGLNAEQVRYIQQHLQTGCFVCQLGDGAYRQPFLCRIPPMTLQPPAYAGSDLGPLKALPTA